MQLKIQQKCNRDNLIIALAENGYKSYVEIDKNENDDDVFYVIVEEKSSI